MSKVKEFDLDERLSRITRDYEKATAYQGSLGITRDFPKFVRYFEGKQWPKATRNTENLPRPVINIIKMMCRSKKSAILSKKLSLVFKSENRDCDVTMFNEFASYVMKELKQEKLDKEAIDDAVKKGPYCFHYYFDTDEVGKDADFMGALRCEIIDPLNVLFANPKECDEQKQKWIMIVSREEVSAVRAKCDEDLDPEMIRGDESEDKYGNTEQESEELCTVFTRYFRIDGEVYYERATKGAYINKPTPLAPDIEAAKRYLGFEEEHTDAPNADGPDGKDGRALRPKRVKAPLYPVVMGYYERREGSIYGIGEVEGLIPNQKSINFQFAMSLLNAQELAWGKYIVLPGALQGQVITNEPAQVLVDHTSTGNGIKKLSEQPLQGEPTKLAEQLITLTRSAVGATEVMSGEVIGANMSGAAIANLQAQATQPIEDLADNFRLVKEKQGRVVAQFLKLYYYGQMFKYEREEPVIGEDGSPVMTALGRPKTEKREAVGVFSSSDYEGVDFDVICEAVSGTKSSAAGDIQLLETLFREGKITLKTFIELYPDDAISSKTEILRQIEAEEESLAAELRRQLTTLESQLTAALEKIEADSKTVEGAVSVMNENARLRAQLIELYAETTKKLQTANEQIALGNAKIGETTEDARYLAQSLWNEKNAKSIN